MTTSHQSNEDRCGLSNTEKHRLTIILQMTEKGVELYFSAEAKNNLQRKLEAVSSMAFIVQFVASDGGSLQNTGS